MSNRPLNLSYQQKVMILRQRYRSTKDLWLYMTEKCKFEPADQLPIVGYLMPPLKTCRLQFIQQVLSHQKKALLQKDVPTRMIPHWPQLGVKYVYP